MIKRIGLFGIGVTFVMARVMGAETYLPVQDITIGGTLDVPACVVKQTSSQLTLKTKDASPKQPQFVHLSQCDVEAVDVAFRTTLKGEHEHWGGLNVPTPDGKAPIPTNQWHYRVSPADASTASSMVLQQGADLVADTPLAGDKTPRRYFRLDGTRYAYTVAPEGGHTEAVMAFWVSLHHGEPGMMESAELLEGGFSVELTYR